jgi:DNA-binding MarR family transcriptional regulator
VLRCDEEGKTVNQRTIENALNLSNPTVSGILTRLEDKHYINRTECTSDARVKLITPTGTSKMLKNSLLDFFDKENDRLTNGFTETELADLKRLLDKVAANLDIKSKRKSLVF